MASFYTKEDLDKAGCATPNCGHDHSVIWLHAKCHNHGGADVRYEKPTGELVIECHVCHAPIVRIKL